MKKEKFIRSAALKNVFSSLIAVAIGLLIGFVVLLMCGGRMAFPAMYALITGGFPLAGFAKTAARICYYAVPLIVLGLSVSFAFKTENLNLGASGQYWVGGFVAIVISLSGYETLGSLTWIVACIGGTLIGGLIALLPGAMKAYRNVNIVISCIMMNYLATYGVSLALNLNPKIMDKTNSWTYAIDKGATLPKWGLDKIFPVHGGAGANAGIIIALLTGIIIWFVIEKTVFGYELKMCGLNRHAANYAGVNENRAIILSMTISGMLSGFAGALYYLESNTSHISVSSTIPGQGFTGMAVALLGMTHPVGVILAGLFVAYIQVGGINLQAYGFASELVDIIIAVIIYSCSFSQVIAGVIGKKLFTARQAEGSEGDSR